MSARPCLHCALTEALVEHLRANPDTGGNEVVEALGKVVGEFIGTADDRERRLALTRKLGVVVAAVSVFTAQSRHEAVH